MDGKGNGGGGAPWWLDAVLKLGIPNAIALYLTWYTTTELGRLIAVNNAKIETLTAAVQHLAAIVERLPR